ncbi:MAG: peptidoglycan D,D-transpeptidase FtsI family protein [Opitutales bacterium]
MAPLFEKTIRLNLRLALLAIVCTALCATLVGGLAYRQLVLADEYWERGERQSLREILRPGPRGDILDRHGEPLVLNRARFSAVIYLDSTLRQRSRIGEEMYAAYLAKVREVRRAVEALPVNERPNVDTRKLRWDARVDVLQRYLDQVNAITGRDERVDPKDVRRHFQQELILPFKLMEDLNEAEFARLTQQLPTDSPVQLFSDTARYYPHGSLAAHTLGYVVSSIDLPEDGLPALPVELRTFKLEGKVGKTGLELAYDTRLQGQSGRQVWRVDPVGYPYECIEEQLPVSGRTLRTSLDIELQRIAEKGLGEKKGAVIALEVETGEVLVLASKPDYDLNDMTPFISRATWNDILERGAALNRATRGLYPPGSTFKIITAAAALENEIVEPDEILYCGGVYRVGNRDFPEHSGRRAFGQVDVRRALQVSSNVFFYQIGTRLGAERLADLGRAFGLDQPTGIDLPFEEKRGIVPGPDWKRALPEKDPRKGPWVGGDTANMSIGQGFLLTTPLRMACFAASLARREMRTHPTLLHDPAGNRERIRQNAVPLSLADENYQAIVEGMEMAVSDGTARFAQVPGVRVAGKTGTAQVTLEGQKTTIAWFLGFAPVEDPKIAVIVTAEGANPNDGYAGGRTAAPIAGAIFDAYFASAE